MTDLRQARLIVSGDALMTVAEAASLIGGRGARAWVEAHVPIRYAGERRLVLWRDVIDATRCEPAATRAEPVRRRAALRRASL